MLARIMPREIHADVNAGFTLVECNREIDERKTQLYEQGATVRRIGQYVRNWYIYGFSQVVRAAEPAGCCIQSFPPEFI